jgi:murein L,D-transpeptidase YafK
VVIGAALVAPSWLLLPNSLAEKEKRPLRQCTYSPSEYGPDVPLADHPPARPYIVSGRVHEARIEVLKEPHKLLLYSGEHLLKTYRIELGQGEPGPKARQGDGRTPEGEYYICQHQEKTHYHRALVIGYPGRSDAERGLRDGIIDRTAADRIRARASQQAARNGLCPPQQTGLGGFILIHGQHPRTTEDLALRQAVWGDPPPPGRLPGDLEPAEQTVGFDWTLGCIGLTNPDIRELYALVPDGTRVSIRAR